jgi:hypothetical protein
MAKADPFSRFVKADAPYKPRIIGRSAGEPGTGKTHFWLGAPGPIVVMSFDQGLEGVVEKFQDLKDVHVAQYDWSPTEELSQEEAVELRDTFTKDFEHAIQHARTVIIDRESDLWELFRYAEFGAPNDAPRNYPQLNQRYRRLINMPKSTDINFGLIQGMKSVWGQKAKSSGGLTPFDTGERTSAGFGELEGLVHVNIEHVREDGEFKIRVGKSRGPGAMEVQDQEYAGLTFAEFGQLLFPDSDEDSWT